MPGKISNWSTIILALSAAASWADSWNEGATGAITAPSGTKVGIGIASPSATLDVNGSANISTTLGVTGAATFASNIIKNSGYASLNGDDNQATLFEVLQGSNPYIHVDNRNGVEAVSLGNTTTNPAVKFLGSGTKAFSGPVTMSSALDVSGLGTFANQIALSRANGSDIYNTLSSQSTAVWGGNIGQGGNILLFGPAHSTLPNYWRLRHGTTVDMEYNGTNIAITPAAIFSSNIIQNSGYTSLNGDDNQATLFEVKQSTNAYIHIANTNGTESVSIGNTTTNPGINFLGAGTKAFSGPVTMSSNLVVDGIVTGRSAGTGKNSAILASSAIASHAWNESDAATDTKLWDAVANSGVMSFRTRTDAGETGTTWLSVARSGTSVSSISLQGPVAVTGDLEGQSLVRTTRANGSLAAFASKVTGDVDNRFRTSASGKIEWGPGSAATDVSLERGAVSTLQLTGALAVTSTLRTTGLLTANGGIHVEGDANVTGNLEVSSVKTTTWTVAPDYVFEKDYKLASLRDVETFIGKNKHLPEVPSAKEFKEKGMDLTEMNFILLKKIEELTLHAIKNERRVQEHEERNHKLEEEVRSLKKAMESLAHAAKR